MFFDCHIHMILDGVYYRAAIDAQKERADEPLIRSRLRAYADAGVIYLRDGGDAWNVGKRAAELAQEYGIEYRTPIFPIHRRGRYGGFIGCGFDDMKGYRALVARAKREGADFIKIMISGLMDFDRFGVVTSEPLEPSEIREMIHIAHGEGFAVMAHANGARTVLAAVEAGVDSVEHGAYMDDETVRALAASDAIWVPTLATVGDLIGCGRYSDDTLRRILESQLKNISRCAELGGTIAPGSDAGAYRVFHAQGALDEYSLLEQALGTETDAVLREGVSTLRRRFRRDV